MSHGVRLRHCATVSLFAAQDMVPLGAPALMRYRGRGDVAHTKVNTNAGETGFESWWTPLWCLWRPPALPEWFSFGVSLFLGTRGGRW